MKGLSEDHHGNHQRGDPRKDRPDNEVGPKNRAVPAGSERHPENPRDDGMDGGGNRDDQDRHDGDSPFKKSFLIFSPPPAQRKFLVEFVAPASRLLPVVAQDRQIGNHRDIKIEDASGQVGGDTEDIPEDGGLEPPVEKDIQNPFGMSHVDDDHRGPDHEGNHRDGLCNSRDRGLPAGTGNTEDGGDEGARMADADEKDKVGDVDPPRDVVPHPGDAQSRPELVDEGGNAQQDDGGKKTDEQPKLSTGLLHRSYQLPFALIQHRDHRFYSRNFSSFSSFSSGESSSGARCFLSLGGR